MTQHELSTEQIAFAGLFVTALVTAQLTAAKLLVVSLPLLGALIVPGGTIAYAVTFFASDCMSELYGRRFALRTVQVGFAMNFVLLAIVWLTIQWPAAQDGIDPTMFAAVLGSSTPIVLGSLTAFLVSQHWDVFAFHWLRDRTAGRWLWVRNIGSTATSQLIDTVLFTTVAFVIAPTLLDVGQVLPWSVVLSLIGGQYIVKALIAGIDTPLVYLAVGYLRNHEGGLHPAGTNNEGVR
jgi:uncharacterized integral membrane protein (TIGR00697 family)